MGLNGTYTRRITHIGTRTVSRTKPSKSWRPLAVSHAPSTRCFFFGLPGRLLGTLLPRLCSRLLRPLIGRCRELIIIIPLDSILFLLFCAAAEFSPSSLLGLQAVRCWPRVRIFGKDPSFQREDAPPLLGSPVANDQEEQSALTEHRQKTHATHVLARDAESVCFRTV